MNNTQKDALSKIWRKAREDAGRSQDYMARKLGVSKKTVQNWESGMSIPNQVMALEWFEVLGIQPLPYYLRALYPQAFDDSKNVETALIQYVRMLSPEAKAKLLFVIYGEHGSSFSELIEMLTAHFHTPDANRITVAQNICTNFEIAQATDSIIKPDSVMPDIKILKNAIIKKRNKILGTNDALGG